MGGTTSQYETMFHRMMKRGMENPYQNTLDRAIRGSTEPLSSSSMSSRGTRASGKVSRSLSIHCLRRITMSDALAKKRARKKVPHQPMGMIQSRQGITPLDGSPS